MRWRSSPIYHLLTGCRSCRCPNEDRRYQRSNIDEKFDENIVHTPYGDYTVLFIRSTAILNRGADPLLWWSVNEKKSKTISETSRGSLVIQASSMASESVFSDAGNLVYDKRASLSHEFIRVCMLLRSWQKRTD